MNREQLKELGLTDEQIEVVMREHGKTVNATKEELQTVTSERDSLKEQLSERDKQLEELRKKAEGNEELTAELNRLKELNEKTKQEFQEKLEKQAFDFALERSLANAKVRNVKAVKALLDIDSIKLDGEKLLGLDEQLNALKESDAYLFDIEDSNQQQQQKPNFTTGQHSKDSNADSFAKTLLGG